MPDTRFNECSIFRFPFAFVDKKREPILIKNLDENQGEGLGRMYLEKVPRNSFNGLPPLRNDRCSAWVAGMVTGGPKLVAVSFEKGIVGHTALFPMENNTCEMIIVVSPAFQNRGIGTQLTRCAMQLANEAGFDKIWLSVGAQNYIARHIYSRCGFVSLLCDPRDEVDMTFDLSGFRAAAQTPVKRIMNRKVITLPVSASCRDAIDLFLKHHITALPVIDPSGALTGILSETDLIVEVNLDQSVGTVMTQGVVTIQEDCTAGKVVRLFQSQRFRAIPVVNKAGMLVGIIGRKDILRFYYKNL
jgi:CBS domain-containing protein/GNAT superfamily N-acetyltransferase